jgi:hypothetical protein
MKPSCVRHLATATGERQRSLSLSMPAPRGPLAVCRRESATAERPGKTARRGVLRIRRQIRMHVKHEQSPKGNLHTGFIGDRVKG